MSDQGTEKTNPLHGLEQDGTGTGTGVWANCKREARQMKTVECCRGWTVRDGLASQPDARLVIVKPMKQGFSEMLVLTDSEPVRHCERCGARFTLAEDGTVEAGPSEAKLLAALQEALFEVADAVCWDDEMLWYIRAWGLAATYADAQALWARMGEAASQSCTRH